MLAISSDDLLALLERLADIFRQEKVPYVLIGAWALAVWGRPRATLDFDFLVSVDKRDLARLGEKMIEAGMEIDREWAKWNPMLIGTQLRLQCSNAAVDILRPRDTHDHEIFKRKRKKRLKGRYYWVVAPEDFILQKLKVGRPRDFEDVLSVLERSGKGLDQGYLEKWSERLGITAELDYVLGL